MTKAYYTIESYRRKTSYYVIAHKNGGSVVNIVERDMRHKDEKVLARTILVPHTGCIGNNKSNLTLVSETSVIEAIAYSSKLYNEMDTSVHFYRGIFLDQSHILSIEEIEDFIIAKFFKGVPLESIANMSSKSILTYRLQILLKGRFNRMLEYFGGDDFLRVVNFLREESEKFGSIFNSIYVDTYGANIIPVTVNTVGIDRRNMILEFVDTLYHDTSDFKEKIGKFIIKFPNSTRSAIEDLIYRRILELDEVNGRSYSLLFFKEKIVFFDKNHKTTELYPIRKWVKEYEQN